MDLLKYPKDPKENIIWRHKLLRAASKDIYAREAIKKLFHEDVLFAFNGFFYTLDVRKRPFQHQPFCTWDFQDEAIVSLHESIATGRDEVWEKSRDMGASWMIELVFFHYWLDPIGGGDFLMGSRIEDYVDKKGDMRALFPKMRYALYRLPKWLRPKGFHPRKHDNYMKLENPETGSTVIGESNNANFSTGGRFIGILFDEFAKWESTDIAAWTAAGDATPCRIANSTPFGAGGQYYNLVTDGKTKKTTLHWSRHPEKGRDLSCVWPPPNEDDKERLAEDWRPHEKITSPWYEQQCLRRSKREVAQEIDIDYLGSGNPVFDGKAWDSLHFYSQISDRPIAWGSVKPTELSFTVSKIAPDDPEGFLVIYKHKEKGHSYSIGVDVVEGVEDGDYAVVVVLDRITKSVDGIYWSRIDEVGLAKVVKVVSDYYSPEIGHHNSPWVGIETNGPGLATFDFAVELDVTNLFMAPRYDVVNGGVSYKKGWRTDTNSRNELIAGIKRYLIDRAGRLNSHKLIGECMTFIRSKTGKAQAKAGCHDDTVLAFGIAVQVDEIAPMSDEKVEALGPVTHADVVDRTFLPIEGEPKTLEERCLQDAIARKVMKADHMDDLWEEVLGW